MSIVISEKLVSWLYYGQLGENSLITLEQIRAARGLLDWNQAELAERAGLSVKALTNIERGIVIPRLGTLQAIKETLERAGVEFTAFNGVRRQGEMLEVKTYEGPSCIEIFHNDIIAQLGRSGGEVLLYGVDEEKFNIFDADLLKNYHKQIKASGISERVLCSQSNRFFLEAPTVYRYLPPEQISNVPYAVYGRTLIIINWGPPLQMVHMRSQAIADAYRKQFEFHWRHAKPVDMKLAAKKKR